MEPARYCPRCGTPTVSRQLDGRVRSLCDQCGFVAYLNPAPAAGVILVEDGRVLLVQRKFDPRRGMWTLPAGFVEYDEHIEECAVRETREETNLVVRVDGVFGAYMAMDDPRVRVVLVLYRCTRLGGEIKAGDDASDARFFPLDALPDGIAFQAHAQALADLRDGR